MVNSNNSSIVIYLFALASFLFLSCSEGDLSATGSESNSSWQMVKINGDTYRQAAAKAATSDYLYIDIQYISPGVLGDTVIVAGKVYTANCFAEEPEPPVTIGGQEEGRADTVHLEVPMAYSFDEGDVFFYEELFLEQGETDYYKVFVYQDDMDFSIDSYGDIQLRGYLTRAGFEDFPPSEGQISEDGNNFSLGVGVGGGFEDMLPLVYYLEVRGATETTTGPYALSTSSILCCE